MPVPRHEAKAELFRTLGHPVRIRVLELLCEREHAVHELLANMDVEPSTLSQQLAVLRRAGIVRQQRLGGEVRYSLMIPSAAGLLAAARTTLGELLADQAQLQADLDEEAVAVGGGDR
ncbi:MAG: metalloregulator ArsR/SmtB family transcription factor [Actinobacteria bacterium]|uniref:ArsR/SmtB family transcription factor n=1 Tax=Propionicimonas sp. T2.31MG-18 TaxID=3157620 RepID=UPI0035E88A93|nr:metalloregulator ArsR/SmtB family transcription factor [Actinomycetota bacterium]